MTFKEMEKILKKDGWKLKSVEGSHHQYVHNTKPGKVTVPRHKGDFSPKMVSSILKQAGLK